jgi:hypothetical protein
MTKHINTIVITGGPGCGKAETMSYIARKLEEAGYGVLVVPELAKEMIIAGATPGVTLEYYDFEKLLLRGITERETRYRKTAQSLFKENIVLLLERGVFDAKAFFGEDEWDAMLEELCIRETSLLERYDGVVHLRSLAHGKESEFVPDSMDLARTPLEARIECDKVLRAWTKHPNVQVIDNSTNNEDKMKRALDALIQALPYKL